MGIIGNKGDLIAEEKVDETEAVAFAKEVDAEFEILSAKDGTGIEEYFNKVVMKYYEKYHPMSEKERRRLSKGKDKTKKKCC